MTLYLALGILLLFILISEKYLRSSGEAKLFRVDGKWQINTFLYFSLVFAGLIFTVLFAAFKVGFIPGFAVLGWIGIGLLLFGLFLRIVAIKTLGKYHTRSIVVVPNQHIIQNGVYKYLRHPGYLGTIIGGIGFALATLNWIIITYAIISLLVIFLPRIAAEEKMMIKAFGQDYKEYMKKTKRLIPFVY